MRIPLPFSIICSIFLLLPATSERLRAQQQTHGVITGRIYDSSTSEPLDDAIIFIPMSGIGTSTASGGMFTLRRLPPGDYDLVVSRVGFHREKLHVTLEEGDTLDLEISLTPRPVQSPGVEVRAESEGGSTGQPLFFPDGGEKSWCAYGSETEIPVGILFAGKSMYMYALETTPIGKEKFLRLWLLIYNGSEDTVIFDAGNDIRLDIKSGGKVYNNVRPDTSAFTLDQDVGITPGNLTPHPAERTLSIIAAQSTLFKAAADRFDIMGGGPFLGVLAPPEHPAGVNPRHLKELYDKCMHSGTLGRYRIFPASGVDGFIRFPFPGFHATGSDTVTGGEYAYTYEFVLQTPSGEERIVFTAH